MRPFKNKYAFPDKLIPLRQAGKEYMNRARPEDIKKFCARWGILIYTKGDGPKARMEVRLWEIMDGLERMYDYYNPFTNRRED